ncbi:MAG: RNA polymerase sigma factor [Gaiellaceae bacterium]
MNDAEPLEQLVVRARDGDRRALERLLAAVEDDVYGLAMRMLAHPADAEDATQEILIRVVTRLTSFRGEAAFRTWVYRVAANHLLTTRRRRAERLELTFDAFADDLAEGLDTAYEAAGVDEDLLQREVMIGCTQGMLLCLDRPHRIAYVIGEVFELPSDQAAYVLGVSSAAYRKRLSRARERVQSFVRGHCGIVDPANPCRCRRRVGRAIELGRVDPGELILAEHPRSDRVRRSVAEMEGLYDAAALFRSHPRYRAPETVVAEISALIASDRTTLLADDDG